MNSEEKDNFKEMFSELQEIEEIFENIIDNYSDLLNKKGIVSKFNKAYENTETLILYIEDKYKNILSYDDED